MKTHHRRREELLETSHPAVYWKIRRTFVLSCGYCRPHYMENQGRRPRHGRNDRYKDQRTGRCAGIRTIRDPRFWEGS
jgi:hypothetical protein